MFLSDVLLDVWMFSGRCSACSGRRGAAPTAAAFGQNTKHSGPSNFGSQELPSTPRASQRPNPAAGGARRVFTQGKKKPKNGRILSLP